MKCTFCNIEELEVILENNLAYAVYDKYPVNKGHILVITKRHVDNYFNTTKDEKFALLELIDRCKEILDSQYSPDGYNIGINCGIYAGQTIMHLHIHLIPRYKGDIYNPEGGVRGVIPERRMYK